MTTGTIVLIVVMILSFSLLAYILINNKKRKKRTIFEHRNFFTWTKKEVELFDKINKHRIANGADLLQADDHMLELAKTRVAFWIKSDLTYPNSLRDRFFIHRQPYMDLGLQNIQENRCYDCEDVFEKWVESEIDNKNMLKKEWKYCGISVEFNHLDKMVVCLILSR